MVLKTNIMNKLKLYSVQLSSGGDAYSVRRSPGGESQLVTSAA